jgi:hypothetical protein
MFKRVMIGCVLLVSLFGLFPAAAQDAPPQINAALAALSQAVGRTVTLNELFGWSFTQNNYPDTALGCPQGGTSYAQVVTPGYEFVLDYNGTRYDFRVSADQSIVFLCRTAPIQTNPDGSPCPPPDDPAYLPTRLSIGITAQVEAGGLPNVMREQPGTSSNRITDIPGGVPLVILDGPRCSTLDKLIWWQVNYNGQTGWTVEGQNGDYWMEPLINGATATPSASPTPTVSAREAITTQNGGQLAMLASGAAPLVTNTDGGLFAEGVLATVNVFTLLEGDAQTPAFSVGDLGANITALSFNVAGDRLAAGLENGAIVVIDVAAARLGSPQPLVAQMLGHVGPITALSYDPSGALLASTGADNTIRLWDAATGAAVGTLATVEAGVTAVQFVAGGRLLMVTTGEGTVLFWGVPSGQTAG